MKHHIVYHMDADGHAGGAVIQRRLLKDGVSREDMVFHPIDYGMPIPEIGEKDNAYLVDFSFQPASKMKEFASKLGNRLIWIDHHQTSVDMEKEEPSLADVIGARWVTFLDNPISGCEVAWRYFFRAPIPKVLELIGAWDTWRYTKSDQKTQERVQAFQYRLKTIPTDPGIPDAEAWWSQAFSYVQWDIECMVAEGKALMEYQGIEWEKVMEAQSFEAIFQGMRALIVNQGGNSTMFNGYYDPEKHDIMVTFQMMSDGYLTVSMYTDKTDILNLGKVAKVLGEAGDKPSGGGHPGAAGFQCGWEYFNTLYRRRDK